MSSQHSCADAFRIRTLPSALTRTAHHSRGPRVARCISTEWKLRCAIGVQQPFGLLIRVGKLRVAEARKNARVMHRLKKVGVARLQRGCGVAPGIAPRPLLARVPNLPDNPSHRHYVQSLWQATPHEFVMSHT